MIYETPGFQFHSVVQIRRRNPIKALPAYDIFDVTMEGPRNNYQPAALDSSPPEGYGINGLLIEQSDCEPIDGDQVRYTRTYAAVPPEHSQRESYVYTFPGLIFQGGSNSPNRPPMVRKVISRISYVYQRVSGAAWGGGKLQSVLNLAEFPLQPDPVFRVMAWGGGAECTVAWGAGTAFTTSPSAEGYINNVVGGEIVVESDVNSWMGNIYCKITRYVIAQ